MPISSITPPSGAGKTPEELKREAAFNELVAEMATQITKAETLREESKQAAENAAAAFQKEAAEARNKFLDPITTRIEKVLDQGLFYQKKEIEKLWAARAALVQEINERNKQIERWQYISIGVFVLAVAGLIGVGYWQTNKKAVYDKWWEERYIERPDLKPPQQQLRKE